MRYVTDLLSDDESLVSKFTPQEFSKNSFTHYTLQIISFVRIAWTQADQIFVSIVNATMKQP